VKDPSGRSELIGRHIIDEVSIEGFDDVYDCSRVGLPGRGERHDQPTAVRGIVLGRHVTTLFESCDNLAGGLPTRTQHLVELSHGNRFTKEDATDSRVSSSIVAVSMLF